MIPKLEFLWKIDQSMEKRMNSVDGINGKFYFLTEAWWALISY
ncbi:MAG: hypothetical protein ACP5IB_08660 [Thermoplasmata archaeon]